MMKLCRYCQIEKSLEDFYEHKDYKGGYTTYCKDCADLVIRAKAIELSNNW